jgi:hypothetical protein
VITLARSARSIHGVIKVQKRQNICLRVTLQSANLINPTAPCAAIQLLETLTEEPLLVRIKNGYVWERERTTIGPASDRLEETASW